MFHPRLRPTLGLAAVLIGLAAPAATAKTVTQTARSGSLSASFSFTRANSFSYHHLMLTIRSGGTSQYTRPVSSPFCGQYCQPGNPGQRGASLAWRQLDSGGPQLVLDLYSGGAHCCSIAEIFTHAPGSDRWSKSSFNFGDPGYQLVDLDHNGRDQFLSGDDRFAYAFTDYAASALPLMILRWSNGHFVNVTRSYPARIARDAAGWMKLFREQRRSHYGDTTGIIAAWAADEDALGHGGAVASFLARAAAARQLNSALGGRTPQNASFVAALDRFLHKTGYLH